MIRIYISKNTKQYRDNLFVINCLLCSWVRDATSKAIGMAHPPPESHILRRWLNIPAIL